MLEGVPIEEKWQGDNPGQDIVTIKHDNQACQKNMNGWSTLLLLDHLPCEHGQPLHHRGSRTWTQTGLLHIQDHPCNRNELKWHLRQPLKCKSTAITNKSTASEGNSRRNRYNLMNPSSNQKRKWLPVDINYGKQTADQAKVIAT